MDWWTEFEGEDGVEMGRTYKTRMGCVSGGSPSAPRKKIHPNKVARPARAPLGLLGGKPHDHDALR